MLLTLIETNDPAWAESPRSARRVDVRAAAAASVAQDCRAAAGGGVPGRGALAAAARAATARTPCLPTRSRRVSWPTRGGAEAAGADHAGRGEEAGGGDRAHPPRRRSSASTPRHGKPPTRSRSRSPRVSSEKQNAVKWAQESLARFRPRQQAGTPGDPAMTSVMPAELTKALEKLAQSGMLAGAPAELQRAAEGRQAADRCRRRSASSRRRCPSTWRKPTDASASTRRTRQGVRAVRSVGVPARSSETSPDGDGDAGTRRRQSRPRRRGAHVGAGNGAVRQVQGAAAAARRRAQRRRLGAGRRDAGRAAGEPRRSPVGGGAGSTPPPPARAPGAARSRRATRAP